MKYLKIIFLLSILLSSCENLVDNKETISKAEAGEDQITYAGSYTILDPSQSTITGDETIYIIEWIQDPGNPDKVFTAWHSTLEKFSVVGFVIPGTYKFTLRITCNSGNIYTDDIAITVKQRQTSVIEDANLESQIRHKLNLKEGDLTAEKLQSLDSLAVTVFYYNENDITSIQGIENCTNLTYLRLELQSITDISPVANLTKLEYLDFNQNRTIEDISPISNLNNLKKLILYSNPIKDISAIANLLGLKELWLGDTPVSDITRLTNLVNLEVLYFDGVGTGISFNSIEPLANLTKLTKLNIAGRGIKDIKPLANLTELILLNVNYNNEITEISAVSKMKKLIRLQIRDNKINDISGIKNLEDLDYLDAPFNQIKDISELQYLPKIHLIGLSDNKIEDISPLVDNPNLGKGVHVFLHRNPLSEKSINECIPELIARGVRVNWE